MALLRAGSFGSEADADGALERFDLSVELVHSGVVMPAVVAASGVSGLAPRSYRGSTFHAKATEGLRSLGVQAGWTCDDADGVARLVSRDGTVVVVVATGNEFTGVPGGGARVTTKNPHGPKLLEGGLPNDGYTLDQLTPEAFPVPAPVMSAPTREVWLLLLRPAGDQVQMELSRPGWMDGSGYPCRFAERILLPPYRLAPVGGEDVDLGDDDIDVPVLDRE